MDGSKLNQEAARTYSQSFSSKILDNFFSENDGITGQQILNVTPVKQINFFILKVLFNQWQEETKKFQSPFFNYRNENVKTALRTLVNTLSKNIYIERHAFAPLLENATYESLLLICEPESFYDQEVTKFSAMNSIAGLKALSKYIKLHREHYDALISKIEASGQQTINQQELGAIYREVADVIPMDTISSKKELELFNAVLPLDVFDEPEPILEEEPNPLPTEMAEPPARAESYPTLEEPVLEEPVLEEPVLEESVLEESVPEEHEQPVAEFEETQQEVSIEEGSHSDTENIDDQFEPVADEEVSHPVNEETIETAPTINEQFSEDRPTLNEQFETDDEGSTIAETHAGHAITDLHRSISINQRYMFLNDLFGGNAEEYENALIEVEMSDSFDDSVEMLVQNYSKKYQWDMNSDEVKELLKVIFKKFR